jgi:hypothetical protein
MLQPVLYENLSAVGIGPIRIGPVAGWMAVSIVLARRIAPVGFAPVARLGAIGLTGRIGPIGIAPITGAIMRLIIGAISPFATGLTLTVTPLAVAAFQPLALMNAGPLPVALPWTGEPGRRAETQCENGDGLQKRVVKGHTNFP